MRKQLITAKRLPFVYMLCAMVSVVSCKPTLYFPERVHAPGFTKKGQVAANFSLKPQSRIDVQDSTLKSSVSSSVDLGYAFADNFAILGSFRGLNDKSVKEHDNVRRMGGMFNGRKTEVALGYFNNNDKKFIFESYLGYGNGTIFRKGLTKNKTNDFRADYNSYFLQSAYGFHSENVRITAGMKFMTNHYYRLTSTNPDLKYQIGNNDGSSTKDITKRAFFFLTPFVNFEVGHKFIMFNIQSGLSTQLGGYRFFASPFYTTFGVSFRLDAIKAKS